MTGLAYTYDGDGKRVKSVATGPGVPQKEIRSLWDRNGALPEVALERDGAGLAIRRYAYGIERIAVSPGAGAPSYYHRDALGSVGGVSNAAGGQQWSYSYEPFGAARTATKIDPLAPENPMRFTGQLLDATSGLYHLRARDYDTSTGRFLRPDPLAASFGEGSTSSYAYADNSPTGLVDPSGLRPSGSAGFSFGGWWKNWQEGWRVTPGWAKGAMIAGIIIPATVICFAECAAAYALLSGSRSAIALTASARQIQHAFSKHASDFGITSNFNPANAQKFFDAVRGHVAEADRIIQGIFRGAPVTFYVKTQTGLTVITTRANEFMTGYRLSPAQLSRLLETGKIGGG